MENIIISLIILLIVGFAIYYIVKEKRKGRACIGCPVSGKCPRKSCNCGGTASKRNSRSKNAGNINC